MTHCITYTKYAEYFLKQKTHTRVKKISPNNFAVFVFKRDKHFKRRTKLKNMNTKS